MLETLHQVLALDLIWVILITFAGGLMLGYTGWGGLMVSIPFLTFLYGPVEEHQSGQGFLLFYPGQGRGRRPFDQIF